MIQTIFNNKKSYTDFNITLDSFSIAAPSKKKIKESVPFMNGSYDFSTIGSNGEIIYDERIIKVKYNLKSSNRASLWNKYSEVLEWLMDGGQSQLIFTDMPDYYYLAEVENAPDFETIIKKAGIMEATFTAQPFKIGVDFEGNKEWDTFNFETDVLQDTEFDIVDSSTVNIINVGRIVCPTINVNAAMSLIFNSKTYNLTIGDNKFYDLKLQPGDNSITINGTGHIKFIFRKQVL